MGREERPSLESGSVIPRSPKKIYTSEFEQFAFEKWWLGRRSFPIGKVTFQGQTVELQVGKGFTMVAIEIWVSATPP